MNDINNIFPNTTFSIIVQQNGRTILENPTKEVNKVDAGSVLALKQASEQFGQTLGQSSAPVVTIKGSDYMFSLFELPRHKVLAFMTELNEETFDFFDSGKALLEMEVLLKQLGDALEEF